MRSVGENRMLNQEEARESLKILDHEDRDLFFYSGDISQANVDQFLRVLSRAKERERKNVSLVLSTFGGDIHAAYRFAKLIQDRYGLNGNFRLVVLGSCRTAGALVTLGASELAMGMLGQLSPIAVQVPEDDGILGTSSGFDTLGLLGDLEEETLRSSEHNVPTIDAGKPSSDSLDVAFDALTAVVADQLRPFNSHVDPHTAKVAREYGQRLGGANLRENQLGESLDKLIGGYPGHHFTIDAEAASRIFSRVLRPSDPEDAVFELFTSEVFAPKRKAVIIDVFDELKSRSTPDSSAPP